MTAQLDPIPPGEILLEEFLKPMGVTQRQLAADLDVSQSRISDIVNGTRAISADTALRLAEYLGTDPEMWLRLQMIYDLQLARAGEWEKTRARIRPLNAAQPA